MALLLETGLLLVLLPWSTFWERNYFVEWSPAIEAVLTSNYLRGAISGLGLVNLGAALIELADVLGNRSPVPSPDDPE
ncbi:MAG: hypothetical protein AB7P34_18445 [Vicinamibacterales bacterium]